MLVRASSSTCSKPSTRHCRDRPVVTQRGCVALSRCQLQLLFLLRVIPQDLPLFSLQMTKSRAAYLWRTLRNLSLGDSFQHKWRQFKGCPGYSQRYGKPRHHRAPSRAPRPAAGGGAAPGWESLVGSAARRGDATGAAPGVSPAAGPAPGAAVWGRPRGCPRLRPAPGPPLHPGMGRPS